MLALVILLFFKSATGFFNSNGPPFTIVVLPDTQYYSSFYEETFQEQTFWACQCTSETKLNLIFVSHLGDIVHRGNHYPHDWLNAGQAINNLVQCGMPHGLLPGNHDYDKRYPNNYRYFMQTFPLDRYTAYTDWFGGSWSPNNMRNSYQLFENPSKDKKFVFVHLQYLSMSNETMDIIAWVSSVLDLYSDRVALLSTHHAGSACSDYIHPLVELLYKKHCNLLMVFGGHVTSCGGERTIPLVNDCNQTRYVYVSNYQNRHRGGTGWLRYYTFVPAEEKVCGYTYSPYLHAFEFDNNSHFSLNLTDMSLGEGCQEPKECHSQYASPGFVLGILLIADANILLLHFFAIVSGVVHQRQQIKRNN